jgi:hypothetical protein
MTAGMPIDRISSVSLTIVSGEKRYCPGMEGIGSLSPRPCFTKRGKIRSFVERVVSLTISLIVDVLLKRRGRMIIGMYPPCSILIDPIAYEGRSERLLKRILNDEQGILNIEFSLPS